MSTQETRTKIVWDYAPAPESPEHVRLRDSYGLYIGGEFRDPVDGRRVPTINPATEETVAEVAFAGEADLRAAVESARAAQPGWAALSGLERGKYLFRVARLIQERARELAVVESMDGGKPIRESRDVDVPLAAAHFFYYAGWADKLSYGVGGREVAPLGVAAQIVPWNFPLLMAAWKLAPALACGNTAVLKPAETTPLSALLLAEICQEAELPPGVVSIVPGDGAAGAALVRQPGIDKVAFTGSTGVGKDIQAALAGRGVSLTLELGGKSANIVFEDAALDQAVEGIVNGIFFNQGHVCCAGSRLLIQESVADVVVGKLWERMGRLRLGDPLDKNTDVGAINSREQLTRIEQLVSAGEGEGAVRRTVACELPERGFWFAPTIFTEVAPAHRIAVEEIFGPVVSVLTFRTQAEAIEKANNSTYGLAAGIWTDKGAKAFEVASALNAGVVWQNTYNHFDPTAAFGGYKESGFGREGGPAGLRPYLRVDMSRLGVRKTYKLYVGGAFVRSESGRYDRATDAGGEHIANVPRGSRKDVRDAVKAARTAAGPWAGRTAYNRGQILYRAAEALESRGGELGVAPAELEASIDVLVHYAGWTDKLQAVLGGINPVAAPFLSFSMPEPTGVVGLVAPDEPELLGLVAELAPALAAGNTVVAAISEAKPLAALDLAEVLGVSDLPAGVVNLLSGRRGELALALAAHHDLNALVDCSGDPDLATELDKLAAESVTRVRHAGATTSYAEATRDALSRLEGVTELKTAWHPIGA